MTRPEAIRIACALTALAYHSLATYDRPSDGFCDECPGPYQNDGHVFRWIRDAILLRLAADGRTPHQLALDDVNRRLGDKGDPHA